MLFYQYTGFSAVPQAPEWLSRADNSHIVYVSFLDEETGRRYHKFRKNLFLTSKETTVFHGDELHSKIDVRPVWKRPALLFPPRGLYRPHSSVRPAPPGGALLAGAGSAPVGSVPHGSPAVSTAAAENARFLALAGPAIRWLRMRRTIRRDKEHRYFKCPNCGTVSAVPRGKGKITVNCRNCGASFEERS